MSAQVEAACCRFVFVFNLEMQNQIKRLEAASTYQNAACRDTAQGIDNHFGCAQDISMASITIKGIPEGLHRRIKERARRNRRSLMQEAVECLERGVQEPQSLESLVEELQAGYRTQPGPLTQEMVDEASAELP